MGQFTKQGHTAVADIAERYQLSVEAIEHMLIAVNNGQGSMAQFNCPELGGSGQWMRGGMTMVGDMFNHSLKSTVDSLCNELSSLLASIQVFSVVSTANHTQQQWWPAGMGVPSSSGSQNNSRYAVFRNRLVIDSGGEVTVYDTLDHQISGVSQQQGNSATLAFSSQHGTVSLDSLPRVSSSPYTEPAQSDAAAPSTLTTGYEQVVAINGCNESTAAANESGKDTPDQKGGTSTDANYGVSQGGSSESAIDTLALIEKLAQLHTAGILSDDEFNTKKRELLARI